MNVKTNNEIKSCIALAALEAVIDPEIGLNIVDLGLILGLDFDESKQNINVTMTLTTPFCPMGETISGAVKRVLENTFRHTVVLIDLNFDQPWNHGRISEEGLKFLNS
ncbi:MAG TPA: metal-sulfur cluster assembly factor [Chitinophagaceae bacterium]|nr:metal-sulfur cluster assembly factor [Chitinophagaceae bacterium]